MKELKDYLQHYLGCKVQYKRLDEGQETLRIVQRELNAECLLTLLQLSDLVGVENHITDVKLILRPLSDLSQTDLAGLLISEMPFDMEDAPEEDEYELDMFYNDGGNMVDGDIAVGANISCRCYTGQVAIRHNGTVINYKENGDYERPENSPATTLFLLSKGFDLFGLISAGLALDSTTVNA